MEIYETQPGRPVNHPWLLSFVLLFLVVFGALLLTQGLAIALIPLLFNLPFEEIVAVAVGNSTHENARMSLLFIQAVGGGGGFLLGGWIFLKFIDKKSLNFPVQWARVRPEGLGLLVVLVVGFILFNSLFVYLNAHVQFPAFLSELESVLRAKEDELMKLTLFITDFENVQELLMGIFVIGIMAGIGEEYLFRGILQAKMHGYTGNVHLGIWITAAIFSAIHMQFYGFLPRMMLGALFGYLYVFSGSLIYPILAHILNNTFTVFMVYAAKLDMVDFDLEEPTELYWHYVLIGLVVFAVSARYFMQLHPKKVTDGEMA
ncbi:MAG: CPBP family intramembrane metalloprotease [Lunatimonas sp.]|uniref:CPBP family intramembrane glutamic endopeptidase n=1 Tax=Lunatimonas sp. TaxID=2060141 RepID=UPI00263AB526|nr:CPBP family intramembrane glutamic endopeptidase [Lunatimonas sp.]MCC5939604.1 CPBP family intramembrane metalloprotease [Lunatimonas sp.]